MDANVMLLLVGVYLVVFALISSVKGFWTAIFKKVFPFFSGAFLLVSYFKILGFINL
jgi:hypothetical protein